MSNDINATAAQLREAANKATSGPWFVSDEGSQFGIDDGLGGVIAITHQRTPKSVNPKQYDRIANAKFIATANPEAVLVVLDALEDKAKKEIWLKEQLAGLANFNPDWDMLQATQESLREHTALLNDAQKRIAELESQPIPGEVLDIMEEVLRISDRKHDAWDRARAAISACRSAMLSTSPATDTPGCPKCRGTGSYHCLQMLGSVDCECTIEPSVQQPVIPKTLLKIGELIRIQDNRGTDQPLFAVMQKREYVGDEDYNSHLDKRIVWVFDSEVEADEKTSRRLEALHKDGRDTRGWERFCMIEVNEFVTACFTEQGCKDYLKANGHNLKSPFIYAFGSYRNAEFQAVRSWLEAAPAPEGE